GGALTARSVVVSADAELAGSVRTEKGLKARSIELERKSEVSGPLVGESVRLGRKCRANSIWGDTVRLGERCEVERVYGRSVELDDGCHVGEVQYTERIATGAQVSVRSPAEKVSTLPPPPL
ncbi:MAG: hypothetical protein L3K07_04360, partial [Thermoplasmata archaeon]|nr:hypothetical protein [Thermoplasmata archaeon]